MLRKRRAGTLGVARERRCDDFGMLSAQAAAYGTAFWVSAGLTALAIIPCIILLRAERAARAAKGAVAAPDAEAMAEAIAA